MADFLTAYRNTGRNEGGWNLVEGDSGGETYCGISRRWFPGLGIWAVLDERRPIVYGKIFPALDSAVEDFYRSNFWNPINGDQIDDQEIANKVYDIAVNMSVEKALEFYNQSA